MLTRLRLWLARWWSLLSARECSMCCGGGEQFHAGGPCMNCDGSGEEQP